MESFLSSYALMEKLQALSAERTGNETLFRVWAPLKKSMRLHLVEADLIVDMEKTEGGYWETVVQNLPQQISTMKYLPDRYNY